MVEEQVQNSNNHQAIITTTTTITKLRTTRILYTQAPTNSTLMRDDLNPHSSSLLNSPQIRAMTLMVVPIFNTLRSSS